MARAVVLGAGLGGTVMAYEVKSKLKDGADAASGWRAEVGFHDRILGHRHGGKHSRHD